MSKSNSGPLLALDLEKWRTKYGLTIALACELLGMQRAKWAELQKKPSSPLEDPAVCVLLLLYEQNPDTMPIRREVDVRKFMEDHGYDPESPTDKKLFAGAVGREFAGTYRWLNGTGEVSKPVERIMEAVNRLPSESGTKRRKILEAAAYSAADRMGVQDPVRRGSWRKID